MDIEIQNSVLKPIFWCFTYLLVLFIIKKIYCRWCFVRKVNQLPGPVTIPIFGNLKKASFFNSSKFSIENPETVYHDIRQGLCILYSKEKILRFWVGSQAVIFLFGTESIEALLTSNVSINKSFYYKQMEPWLGKGLLLSVNEAWRAQRKMLTPTFHFRILQDFLPVMNFHANTLVKKIHSLSNQAWTDIVPLLINCTLDIISETAMGVRLNCQEDIESEYAKAVHNATTCILSRSRRPWLWFDVIYNLTNAGREFHRNINVINDTTRKVIREKKALRHQTKIEEDNKGGPVGIKFDQPRSKLAFLDLLLDRHLDHPEFTIKDMTDEVTSFMFGGHDTTAISLTWVLYLLGLHPDIQERVYNEMTEVIGDNVSNVTLDHVRELKYVDMVLKECQRLYPTVPGFSRTIEEDLKIGNQVLPKGVAVFVFSYMLHRDASIYPNPEKFDPERFSSENSIGRNPYTFIPFSAGPRNCLGQKFALMEEKVVLSHVLLNFKVTSLDPRDKMLLAPDLVLRPKDKVRLKFQPRTAGKY